MAKRPLLPREDRQRLNELAIRARRHRTGDPAYARGVEDVLRWLNGDPMSPLLEEVTR